MPITPLCACGATARPQQRTCRECHAAAMRARRAARKRDRAEFRALLKEMHEGLTRAIELIDRL